MERRTEEIIAVCKGRHPYGENLTFAQRIAAYMSDRCDYPAEDYTEGMLRGILLEAVWDYIDGADKPSCFLRQISESYRLHDGNLLNAICGAFSVTCVRDDNQNFINGFTEKSVFKVEKSDEGNSYQ